MAAPVVLKTLFGCTGCMAAIESLNKESLRTMDLMTFTTFLFVSLHGVVFTSKFFKVPNRIPIVSYLPIVVIFFLVSTANNHALSYSVPIPLVITLRSGALVSNMLIGKLWLRHSYSTQKLVSILVITVGIVLFTLETVSAGGVRHDVTEGTTVTQAIGVTLLIGALLFSSFLGHYQQKLYVKYGKHDEEAMFYVHLLSLPGFLLLLPSIRTGMNDIIISPHLQIAGTHIPVPVAACKLVLIIIFQWICIKNVYRLTSVTDSLNVTLVTTLRKFLSLSLSVIFFDNRFTIIHGAAFLLVTLGTFFYNDSLFAWLRSSWDGSAKKKKQ
uniref:UAA transporter n=1 Tax=Steinernema glaseri TaxID=37863 RepID=A0A1I8AU82_9BILA